MGNLGQDLALALRIIRKHPGFSALIVVCLGLGIGVNSAIFSVVDAVLLRPLPYEHPERLVVLQDVHMGPAGEPVEQSVAALNFLAWRERARSFETLAAMATGHDNLTGSGLPERVNLANVTADLFPLLGVRPALGRSFLEAEDRPGGPLVAVISNDLWHRRFAADPRIAGRGITLNDQSYTVVGVLPPGFKFMEDVDVWVPLAMDPANPPKKQTHYLLVAGHLKPGVPLETAQRELSDLSGQLAREHPDTNEGWSAKVVPLRDNLVGEQRRALLVLLISVGLVLLIACANVANLLIARNLARSGEIALRSALGAVRRRIVGQMLTESVLLSLLGGAFGLLLAAFAIRLAPSLAPPGLIDGVGIDWQVLVFTLAISLLAGVLPGIVPALRASSPQLSDHLRQGGQRSSEGLRGRRLQSSMVVFEIALAFVLLVFAGLMVKSLKNLYQKDPGVRAENVLTLQITLPEPKYHEPFRRSAFWRDLVAKLRSTPGVLGVSGASVLPVAQFSWTTPFIVEGQGPADPGNTPVAHFRRVTSGYFETLRIPIREGRGFSDGDDENSLPVAVVSRQMALRYWPGESAVGKRIQRVRNVPNNPWLTVVGVAEDVQDMALDARPDATMYTPYPQGTVVEMNLLVRTAGDPLKRVGAVRQAILAVDPEQSVSQVRTLDDWISSSLLRRRFSTLLLVLFAALGLVLAGIGLYGVLSYAVDQRRREIGLRMALGAEGGDVIRMIVRQGMGLTLAGLVLGLAVSIVLTRVLSALLFEVTPTDPVIFGAIPLGLAAVAFAATYLPARRAARVDPILLLRAQ
jgi:putative ABC transport system permease protein